MPKQVPPWLSPLVLGAVALVAYLLAGPLTFPMDDAYIHAVYGRNLAELGALTFNTMPPDTGIGTTSIAWTLLLTAGAPVVGVVWAARLLGMISFLATLALVWVITGWLLPGRPAARTFVTSLVALSGNLIWFSLSGMETMFWLALGLGAVVAYQARRWWLVGLLIGVMTLTRAEGVVLMAAVWAVELYTTRRVSRGLLLATGLMVLLWAPWLLFMQAKTGAWLPTSFSGKKHAQVRGAVDIVQRSLPEGSADLDQVTNAEQMRLPWWIALLYPAGVIGYGATFVAGAGYLPGPKIPLGGPLGEVSGGLSILGILALLVVFLPTLISGLRGTAVAARERDAATHSALLLLGVWVILHNLAYWYKLPTPGTASRYQVVNHVAWWLLAGLGAVWLEARPKRAATMLLALLVVVNAAWWRGVYGADCRHMEQVRLASAAYLANDLPADAVVAAHDIGALGWAGQRRILDMGGLIDPAYMQYAAEGRLRDWFIKEGAGYVVLPDKHSTETAGFYDYAAALGLDEAHGFRLVPLAHFENDYEDWKLGAAPTWNALPGVTVYRLELLP